MFQLLKILAKAKEFEMLRVRPEESWELKKIFQYYWIFEDKPTLGVTKGGRLENDELEVDDMVIETEEKVMALISGYIA
jgi:activating signal cointegrator complex subunit 3